MSYQPLFRRAFEILLERKFLIGLGVLAALAGGPGAGYSNTGWNTSWSGSSAPPTPEMPGPEAIPPMPQFDAPWAFLGLSAVVFMVLIGIALLVALALWVVSTLANGALIAGVSGVERDDPMDFSLALRAAWSRAWQLLGVNLIPSIPIALLLLMGLFMGLTLGGAAFLGMEAVPVMGGVTLSMFFLAFCLLMPISLVLSLLRTFAYRACMLEGESVLASYRRGWTVLGDNLGPALAIFLLQVVLLVLLYTVLFLPTILLSICCLLWPIFLLLQGIITAYFSALWTLVWESWTGHSDLLAPVEA